MKVARKGHKDQGQTSKGAEWRNGQQNIMTRQKGSIAITNIKPTGHMTFIQPNINVDATLWRCIDVNAALYKRQVSDEKQGPAIDEPPYNRQ